MPVRWATVMELETPDSELEGWTLVAVSGEVDVTTGPTLRAKLTELVDAGQIRVVVDLSNVDFIDSTGLGVLVGAARRARAADGDVRLACTNARILKVIGATGLDEVFVLADTPEQAAAQD